MLYYGLLLGCGGIPYGWTSIVFTDRDVSSVNICFENSDSLETICVHLLYSTLDVVIIGLVLHGLGIAAVLVSGFTDALRTSM